jgi:hypothetical protein
VGGVTVSYQITRKDYTQACVAMCSKTRWYLFWGWCLLFVFCAWLNWRELRYGPTADRIAALVPLAGCAVVFVALAVAAPHIRARRGILRPVTWIFTDDNVQQTTDVSSATLRWEAFIRSRETRDVFLLFVQKGMAQFVPKRALSSEQEIELRCLIAAHVKKA